MDGLLAELVLRARLPARRREDRRGVVIGASFVGARPLGHLLHE
ncbi:MAG: hypothetical protein U0183_25555 [Polyangiaceae bacterium]